MNNDINNRIEIIEHHVVYEYSIFDINYYFNNCILHIKVIFILLPFILFGIGIYEFLDSQYLDCSQQGITECIQRCKNTRNADEICITCNCKKNLQDVFICSGCYSKTNYTEFSIGLALTMVGCLWIMILCISKCVKYAE